MLTKRKSPIAMRVTALVVLAACSDDTSAAAKTYQLAFTDHLSNVTAGAAISPVRVELRDARGEVARDAIDWVAVRLFQGGSDHSAALRGSIYKQPVNGVVTFDDLYVTEARSGYVLKAHVAYSDGVSSDAFDVAPASPTKLTDYSDGGYYGARPGGIACVRVKVADDFGNGVPNMPVTFTVTSGGGSISAQTPGSGLTDSVGETVADWTLGLEPGWNTMTIHSSAVPTASLDVWAYGDSSYASCDDE
ncbi:MAG TPA: Ig-like domain-containing protein [Gemmatimonadaceae bacterium]|nr:Ig-like domain-containing protein [Gemmatimonadaceae bacterium]